MSERWKTLSEEEWRNRLSGEEYRICREQGTEPAFSGAYWDCKTAGTYLCKCCAVPLFSSSAKFDSGTGWPSFDAPLEETAVRALEDGSFGMRRTEVRCARCDSHLGHVFADGPPPSGMRYCINSASLLLEEAADS